MTYSPAKARLSPTTPRIGAAALIAFFALIAAALVASGSFSAPAFAYTNPSTAEIRTKLHDAAVARGIPPKILYALADAEHAAVSSALTYVTVRTGS